MKKGLPVPHTDNLVPPTTHVTGVILQLPLVVSSTVRLPCPSPPSSPKYNYEVNASLGKPGLLRPNSLLSKLGFGGSFYFPCRRLVGHDFPTSVCDLTFWYEIATCFYGGAAERCGGGGDGWQTGEKRGKTKDDRISVTGTGASTDLTAGN